MAEVKPPGSLGWLVGAAYEVVTDEAASEEAKEAGLTADDAVAGIDAGGFGADG